MWRCGEILRHPPHKWHHSLLSIMHGHLIDASASQLKTSRLMLQLNRPTTEAMWMAWSLQKHHLVGSVQDYCVPEL